MPVDVPVIQADTNSRHPARPPNSRAAVLRKLSIVRKMCSKRARSGSLSSLSESRFPMERPASMSAICCLSRIGECREISRERRAKGMTDLARFREPVQPLQSARGSDTVP